MSMDLDPVPGLPLITTLFCNTTTVKKKTTVNCAWPDELYTKKSIYGGPVGAGLGAIEILLVTVFVLLSFKMKHDVTKSFLTAIYIPLGLSSVFKVAVAVYSIMEGAYGWCFMVFSMFYNWLYTTAVVSTSIGSVLYLAALIVVARKQLNFKPCDSWLSYFSVLFFSALISGSYHFISVQWNQLPASSLFFTYLLCTIGIVVELLVCLCVGLLCESGGKKGSSDVVVLTGDPVVDDARSRLAFGALAVILMNVPQWFEIYYKITELFTPFLWESDAEKTVYYTAQALTLMSLDTYRIFLSLFMLIPLFVTVSGRYAVQLWIQRKPHPNSKQVHHGHHHHHEQANKVFVASQSQPLLMDTGEKKPAAPVVTEEKRPIPPTPPTFPLTQAPPQMPIPNQVPVPQYPGIGFAPGMLQLPHNMQTTIVYTPSMAYENVNGHMQVEQFK